MLIFTRSWWATVAWPLIRTALAGTAPFIPALLADFQGTWRVALLTVGLAVVIAVATALMGLPDTAGTWWEVAFQRVLRQFGQMIVAATASAALLTDVDWRTVLMTAAGSALTTLILAALGQTPGSQFGVVETVTIVPEGSWTVPGALTEAERHADAEARMYDPTPGVFDPLDPEDRDALVELRAWAHHQGVPDTVLGALDRAMRT